MLQVFVTWHCQTLEKLYFVIFFISVIERAWEPLCDVFLKFCMQDIVTTTYHRLRSNGNYAAKKTLPRNIRDRKWTFWQFELVLGQNLNFLFHSFLTLEVKRHIES